MARIQHSEETRAAVLAALLTGATAGECEERFGVPSKTVRTWQLRHKSAAPGPAMEAAGRAVEAAREALEPDKIARVAKLMFSNVEAHLEATEAIARLVSDAEYLRSQPAGELAVLFGVISDKGVRLLTLLDQAGLGRSEETRQLPGVDAPPVDRAQPVDSA